MRRSDSESMLRSYEYSFVGARLLWCANGDVMLLANRLLFVKPEAPESGSSLILGACMRSSGNRVRRVCLITFHALRILERFDPGSQVQTYELWEDGTYLG